MNVADAAAIAWGDISDREVSLGLAVNHCILGTRVIAEAMRRLDVPVEAVPVETLIANKIAARLIAEGVPTDDWPPNAWSVGATQGAPGSGYPGHLVAVVDQDDGRYLIDSSVAQFQRPQYGIMPPSTLSVRLDGTDWGRDSSMAQRLDAVTWEISWRPAPQLGKLHRSAIDWKRGRTYCVNELVARITDLTERPTT